MNQNLFDDLVEGFDALDAEREGRLTLRQHVVGREQVQCTEIDTIRSALIEGENSGKPRQLDVAAFKRRMRTHV